jgi:sulfite exporter TauE/SafE
MLGANGKWTRGMTYAIGKTATYTFLGMIAGGLGAGIGLFGQIGAAFSILIGILLVIGGLMWAGWLPKMVVNNSISSRISKLLSKAIKRSGPLGPLSLGLVNGLLPCGLLYGALGIAATTNDVLLGALTMTVFGLATIPSLTIFGALASRLGKSVVKYANIVGGLALIAFGVITIMRAISVNNGMMMH